MQMTVDACLVAVAKSSSTYYSDDTLINCANIGVRETFFLWRGAVNELKLFTL